MSLIQRATCGLVIVGTCLLLASCGDSTAPSPTVPAAPTNVTATAGSGTVTITWPAVTDATSYNIYWSLTPIDAASPQSLTQIPGVTSPYVFSGTPVTPYYFAVVATNPTGPSQFSSTVTGTPTGMVAVGGNAAVTIKWTPITGATSYNIYWSTTSGVTPANGTKIAGATSPHLHSGLTDGTPYFYIVTPVTGGVEGSSSAQSEAVPGADFSAPFNVVATGGNGQVTLTWSSNVDCCTASYDIYWSTTDGVTPVSGTAISGAHSAHIHTGLTNGTTYYYVVVAHDINGFGAGEPSYQVSATPSP